MKSPGRGRHLGTCVQYSYTHHAVRPRSIRTKSSSVIERDRKRRLQSCQLQLMNSPHFNYLIIYKDRISLFIETLQIAKHSLPLDHNFLTLHLPGVPCRDTPPFISPLTLYGHYRPQRSWGKVMFLQASVILLTGGVCLSACWDSFPGPGTPPTRSRHNTPRSRHPPHPRTRNPPPRSRPPSQGQAPQPPGSRACWEIRSTSGRYASYWNAILFYNMFLREIYGIMTI